MKTVLSILFLIAVNSAWSQKEYVIRIDVSKSGGHNVSRLTYYDFTDIIKFESLPIGKHKFYIMSDKNCHITLVEDKSPILTKAETTEFNNYFAKYVFEYYDDGTLISDCSKFSSQTFPISILITR